MATRQQLIAALRCEIDCSECAYSDVKHGGCDKWGMRCDAADELEAAEPRVVQCRECRKWDGLDHCCMRFLITTAPQFYCAAGEKRDESEVMT